jgi:hypothetical protein
VADGAANENAPSPRAQLDGQTFERASLLLHAFAPSWLLLPSGDRLDRRSRLGEGWR